MISIKFSSLLFFTAAFIRAVVSTPEDDFLHWFSSNRGVRHGIMLASTGTMGRGVFAQSDVSEGDMLLEVPKKIIICLDTIKLSNDPVVSSIPLAFNTDEEALAAFLLLEKSRNESSFWKPYLDVLPVYIPNLLFFNKIELEALGDDSMLQKALLSRARVERQYLHYLSKAHDFQLPQHVELQEYFWARAVLDSRGLRFQGKIHLAPFTDMFNYEPHHQQRQASMGNFFLKHHALSDKALVVSSDRKFSRGEEVVEDYGDNDDAIYLQYHGFVPDKNPFRCVDLVIPPASSLSTVSAQILTRFGLYNRMTSTCVREDGHLSSDHVVYFAVSAMDDRELSDCAASIAKEKTATLKHCQLESIANYLDDVANGGMVKKSTDLSHRVLEQLAYFLDRQIQFASAAATKCALIDNNNLAPRSVIHLSISKRFNDFKVEMLRHLRNVYKLQDISVFIPQEATILPLGLSLEEKVDIFNRWFTSSSNGVNKLQATIHPIFRVSTIASDDISPEEIYLAVPTSIIVDNGKATTDPEFGVLANSLMEQFRSKDDFHELLFFLLHQRFIVKERSKFWPYLQLLPSKADLDIPLFWTPAEIELRLGPSKITQSTIGYAEKYRRSFDSLRNVALINAFFSEDVLTLDNYLWAVAILDSRSIWWNGNRHLVPMLDLINCRDGPEDDDASPSYRVHSTALSEDKNFAITKAAQLFRVNEHVFENYGQPNHIYFTYHGFTLQRNSYDCVQFLIEMTKSEIDAVDWNDAKSIAQSIGLRNNQPPSLSICLSVPVQANVWTFLSLKANTFVDQRAKGLLKRPTKITIDILSRLVKQRILSYVLWNSSDDHVAANTFLRSELFNLRKIETYLDDMRFQRRSSDLKNDEF